MSDGGTQSTSSEAFGGAPSTTPVGAADSTVQPHSQSTPAGTRSVAASTGLGSTTPGVEQTNLTSKALSQSLPQTMHGAYLYAPGMQSSGASAQTNATVTNSGMDLLSGLWLPSNFDGLGTPHRGGNGWPTGYTPDGRYGNLGTGPMMMPGTPFNPYTPVRPASGHTNLSELTVGLRSQTDPFAANLGVMGQMRGMFTFPPGDTSFEPGIGATSVCDTTTTAVTGEAVSNPADRAAPERQDNTALTGPSGPSQQSLPEDETGAEPMNADAGSDNSVDSSVEDRIKVAVQAEVGRVFAGPAKRAGGPTPPVMRHAVHDAMRTLMGVREKYAAAPGCKKSYVLPDPLDVGDDVRHAGDGARLFNPDWYGNVLTPVNCDYVDTTVGLVQQNAVGFFKNLKRKYLSINDPEAMEKEAKRSTTTISHLRKHRKTDKLRMGFEPFILLFGRDRTLGIEAVVCSPCQSEEESTPKRTTPSADRERCRKKAGVSDTAYQVLKLLWRAPKVRRQHLSWRSRLTWYQLSRTHIVLAVLMRYAREHEDFAELKIAVEALTKKAAKADPNSAEAAEWLEEAKLLRKQYLARVEIVVKGWSSIYDNSALRYQRFVGPSRNWIKLPQANLRTKVIYKECVSPAWVEKDVKHARIFAKLPACPAEFTIFDLELPDSLIPSDDLALLTAMETGAENDGGEDADDEDSDEDEADE
ncbi:hypothetical protein C2E23DRAFT_940808 [Lenzites betulinus]|nr:hypothetical protein C2E23DRAFT_940808 [Lenzites betulinus]